MQVASVSKAYLIALLVSLVSSDALSAATPLETLGHAYASLLLSDRSEDVVLGARALDSAKSQPIELFDLAAERMAISCQGRMQLSKEATQLLSKMLTTANPSRYGSFVRNCRRLLRDNKVIERRSAGEDYGIEVYQVGSVNIDMTRADFKRLSEVAAANRSILNFFFIEGGAPLSEAYTLVGIPDSVSEETIYQDVVRGLIDVNVAHNRIVLNYKGAGSLRFERTDLNGENWQLISVIYDFDLENSEPAIRAAAISQVVSITNLREQLKAIETIARIEIKDRESLAGW